MIDLKIFILFTVGGVGFELILQKFLHLFTNKKSAGFRLIKFSYLLSFPLLGILVLWSRIGNEIIIVYVSFAIVGFILEWCLGFSYEKIMGEKLWIYQRLSLKSQYTSFLTLPLWGFCGLCFWLISRAF